MENLEHLLEMELFGLKNNNNKIPIHSNNSI
jgi:hypothetical protein